MSWNASVLSSVSSDTEPTVVITFDSAKYIFNVGENTTRAFLQSRRNWKKTRGLFLTSVGTQRASGLPGLLMTFADSGLTSLNIAGPAGLLHFMAVMRKYTFRENLSVNPIEIPTSRLLDESPDDIPIYKDDNISVFALPVSVEDQSLEASGSVTPLHSETSVVNKKSGKRKRSPSPSAPPLQEVISHPDFDPTTLVGDMAQEWLRHIVRTMFPGSAAKPAISSAKASTVPYLHYPQCNLRATLAYAVVGPRVRGKFDVKRAEALGLKAGPLRARVARGETVLVVGKDGVERSVGPSDVVGASEDPGVVLILDAPSTAHITPLVKGFERPDKKDHALRVVFHLCGNDVFEDERFEDNVHHIVASRDYVPDPITFTSAAFNQLRLNYLDSNIFPVPKYSLEAKKALDSKFRRTSHPNTDCMRAHTIIDIRPPRPPLRDSEAEANDLFHPAAVVTQFSEAQAHVDEATVPDVIGKDVTVVTLGTGSAIPSKYRNVSGTLVCIPGAGYILLDAGEGTWGQLSRNYGTAVWDVLRGLKCIFISHIHGDHHIGLAKILAMRQHVQPLYLISNRMIFLYLRDYNALEELGFSEDARARVIPILSDEIHWRNKGRGGWNYGDQDQKGWVSRLAAGALCKTLGLQKINTVDVEHRARCHGLIVKHLDGWSVVFSGDTVPTQKLVQAGAGATLLIHEATMANDQVEMARAKMHSTFGQAIDIGKSMNAQNILLTHFSARYPKMPPSVSERQAGDPVVAFAFDHANIKIGDMWKMGAYARAIEQSFIDIADIEGEELEVIDAAHVDIS
ncbi:hypothetical protein DFJ58DRAFT_865981 [Suillus subalutaceus]|uniref:uncharacterized protein n=1 Tax=Suillus subalutaceus TaxID=48586 RepID=UPI001B860BFA|nr:uncharacterized protein DFJ58DRAFT_865981 [Suillus subalutaceus]KAG1876634.1 hypothetical protein DFJ58DRAFT_865981 [Suillus subalutaceus]